MTQAAHDKTEQEREGASWKAIVARVAEEHAISVADILGPSRARKCAWPRQQAYHEIRRARRLSYVRIGQLIGGRDHSTVITGIRSHQSRVFPTIPNCGDGFGVAHPLIAEAGV
jgi:chromosomal replication initiation ATPase DnaA